MKYLVSQISMGMLFGSIAFNQMDMEENLYRNTIILLCMRSQKLFYWEICQGLMKTINYIKTPIMILAVRGELATV